MQSAIVSSSPRLNVPLELADEARAQELFQDQLQSQYAKRAIGNPNPGFCVTFCGYSA